MKSQVVAHRAFPKDATHYRLRHSDRSAYPWCPATLLPAPILYLRVSAADRAASIERTRITRARGGAISSGAVIAWCVVCAQCSCAVASLVKDERLVDAGERGAVPHAEFKFTSH